MSVKVSVIIPVFGVEKYIERCARSLFSQTIDDGDVEFIFVNDCTRDASMDLLGQVMVEYPGKNVTILEHQTNMGLPAARQTGLKAAQGDYVVYCDSDDWVDPDYCRKLHEIAVEEDSDIVVCGYVMSDGVNQAVDKGDYEDTLLADPSKAVPAAVSLKSSPFVWNKMTRRTLYEDAGVQFPRRFLAEDWAITVQLVLSAKKITVIGEELYYYFINPSSMLREPTKELCLRKIADEEENVRLVEDILKQRGLARKYQADLNIRKAITKSIVFPYTSDIECRRVWRKTFREANWPILFNDQLDKYFKRKHLLLLSGLYAPLRRLYHLLVPSR